MGPISCSCSIEHTKRRTPRYLISCSQKNRDVTVVDGRIPKKPMQEEEVRSARIIFYVRLPTDKTLLSLEPAPWTFDPTLLLNCLKNLRDEGSVYVPSFDHGVGDPVENDIFSSLQHKVVIVEGNYILLEEGSWKDVSEMVDEKWFIDVDTAMQRVELRHISTGKPPDVAKWRVDYNDRPNAELIIKSKTNADLLIRSINY